MTLMITISTGKGFGVFERVGSSYLWPVLTLLGVLLFNGFETAAWADEFGRLEGALLFGIPDRAGTRAPAALSGMDAQDRIHLP